MAMDATMQIRMDRDLKEKVEKLYKNLGTSFAEAVRIFARQSVSIGAMPFRPYLVTTDDLTIQDIETYLDLSEKDIENGKVFSLNQIEDRLKDKYVAKQAV